MYLFAVSSLNYIKFIEIENTMYPNINKFCYNLL